MTLASKGVIMQSQGDPILVTTGLEILDHPALLTGSQALVHNMALKMADRTAEPTLEVDLRDSMPQIADHQKSMDNLGTSECSIKAQISRTRGSILIPGLLMEGLTLDQMMDSYIEKWMSEAPNKSKEMLFMKI